LSLELAPVSPSEQGLHLQDLQRIGVLTKVFTDIGEVGHRLAMRKKTRRDMVRSGGGGPGGAPLALVPLLAVAPLPQ
jgi:hypothetical protein